MRTGDRPLRRVGTNPGSSAPMPGTRPRANRTSSIARILPRARPASRSRSTCPPKPALTATILLARGEVGKVGVAISHVGDMRALFEDIPLASMNTSMTINATAPWLMALYIATADEQGAPREPASRHDPERHHQGISGARLLCVPARRVAAADQGPDLVLRPRDAEMESDERLLVPSAGSGRDAGAGTELRARDRDRRARAGARNPARSTSAASPRWSGGISFFVNAGMRFVTELAKMRAFVELWDEITRDRFGVKDPSKRRFRYGVQVNSLGLTEQQPENNAYRILIEMLSVVLSKDARARAVQLPAWNEALGTAASVRPAMVAAPAADHGLRNRPAGIRGYFQRQRRDRRARRNGSSAKRSPKSPRSTRWAASSRRSKREP